METEYPKLEINDRIKAMLIACETVCVKECCGLAAYDFSPLHLASHISAYTREIKESEIKERKEELDQLLVAAEKFKPMPTGGYSFQIEEMNEVFDYEKLKNMIDEVKANIDVTPQILELSKTLEK